MFFLCYIPQMCFKNLTGTRLRVMIWVGFVVGCIAKFITGSLFVYNVYQDDIKQTFNYTQRESKDCVLQ